MVSSAELIKDLTLTTAHSYLVLKCNESLAHQLLFAPDAIAYKLQHSGHFIPVSLLGTLVLMISVIALANAKIQLQIAWAVSYVILNIGHWMAAALPRCEFIFLLVALLLVISLLVACVPLYLDRLIDIPMFLAHDFIHMPYAVTEIEYLSVVRMVARMSAADNTTTLTTKVPIRFYEPPSGISNCPVAVLVVVSIEFQVTTSYTQRAQASHDSEAMFHNTH